MKNDVISKVKDFGPIPVEEDHEYDVQIISMGEKNDGIAKVGGFVVVVPGGVKGDFVRVKISAVRGKVSFGAIVENYGSSPRVKSVKSNKSKLIDDTKMELIDNGESKKSRKSRK